MDAQRATVSPARGSNGLLVDNFVVGINDQGAFVLPNFLKRQDTGNGGFGNGSGNGTATATNTTDTGGTGGTGNGTTTGFGNGVGGGTNSTNSTTPTNSTSSGSSSSGGGNACTAISSEQVGTVINPVMSGRINTRGKKSIQYGKVEVRAKLPQGDWLWPAIWMLPEGNDTSSPQGTGAYGPWPVSGEIDVGRVSCLVFTLTAAQIIEARGNLPSYPAQGSNYVRSTLNYGPFPAGSTPISTGKSQLASR